ncbi:hypothetical protein D9611_003261 [Ephemerocybe angulata]|uniref:FMR1-interacting protein 1 conserved domain-containing protein n=1 Tax=Ephemerocybe angulata TaxID=980116 RepID=A0A8H5C8U7_9AGAR|nr:hypothetical protein D9611_003261 [Tulosesus angulatus]
MSYYNPNLPQNPQWAQQQQQQGIQNPAYSSHYMQAYMQGQAGYYQPPGPYAAPQLPYPTSSFPGPSSQPFSRPPPPTGQWYQHGNKRCTYKGCSFTGSHSSVETHMMDRHLIYPPGWEKRQKKQDWDADPSLKGKPIPIQGTNIILDDPEMLAKWMEERKKRFPTAGKVEDKKRKMDEAIARGQLTAEDMGMRSDKRRRTNESTPGGPSGANSTRGRGTGRGAHRGGDRGRGRGGAAAAVNPHLPVPLPAKPEATVGLPPRPPVSATTLSDDASNSSDSDGEPEVISSKKEVLSIAPPLEQAVVVPKPSEAPKEQAAPSQPRKRPPPQPKKAPRNPFAERPSLLRNLILPEMRVTLSNLSQAIRFLVDNDFLEGVELKPGQATEARIQVLDNQTTETHTT